MVSSKIRQLAPFHEFLQCEYHEVLVFNLPVPREVDLVLIWTAYLARVCPISNS